MRPPADRPFQANALDSKTHRSLGLGLRISGSGNEPQTTVLRLAWTSMLLKALGLEFTECGFGASGLHCLSGVGFRAFGRVFRELHIDSSS